jgi:hypothetical protein
LHVKRQVEVTGSCIEHNKCVQTTTLSTTLRSSGQISFCDS